MGAVSVGERIVESILAPRNTKFVNNNTMKGLTETLFLFLASLLFFSYS